MATAGSTVVGVFVTHQLRESDGNARAFPASGGALLAYRGMRIIALIDVEPVVRRRCVSPRPHGGHYYYVSLTIPGMSA